MASCFVRESHAHGGSGIFVKRGIEFRELDNLKNKSRELIIECTGIHLPATNIIVVCIYRPPSGDINDFFVILEDILSSLSRRCTIVVCGDFNVNFLNSGDKNLKIMLDIFLSFNLKHTIHEPTRICNGSATAIDNIFINKQDYHAKTRTTALSDHLGQQISFTRNLCSYLNVGNQKQKVYKRNFSNCNLIKLKNLAEYTDWASVNNSKDPNECVASFVTNITEIINEACPIICKVITGTASHRKKWINEEIRMKCRIKRQLYEGVQNGAISNHTYKAHCKQLRNLITSTKKNDKF